MLSFKHKIHGFNGRLARARRISRRRYEANIIIVLLGSGRNGARIVWSRP